MRSLRPIMFLANLPIAAATVVLLTQLARIPGLDWSWWQAVTGSSDGGNMMLSGLRILWLLPVAAVLLGVAVPLLAETEEQMFREGTQGWWPSAVLRSIGFGLVHLTAGVPLAAALALTLPGLWFTFHYFQGGLARSTAYRAMWNYQLIAMLIVLALIG